MEWTASGFKRRAEPLASVNARFEDLLAREGAALRRLAASYGGGPPRSEDLFQEICLAVWKALPSFRGESSERTFVFRIAHNRCLTALSREKPATETLEAAHEVAAKERDPETQVGERERRARLHRAVTALPLPLRQVLTLALEGLAQREIGEVLGISENNVAVRLTRARKALRQALGEGGGAGS